MSRKLDDIALSERDQSAVAAAARLLRDTFDVEEVILFGSKARGGADHESDIDLLVLTRDEITPQRRRAMIDALFDIEMRFGVVISPMIVARDAWRHGAYQVLPIRAEIERDGVAA